MNLYYSTALPPEDPLHTLNYKLERLPAIDGTKTRKKCPILTMARNMTYIVRAPFDMDFTVEVEKRNVSLDKEFSAELAQQYVHIDEDTWTSDHIGFQIQSHLMFWTDKAVKGNVQIWVHDVPAEIQTEYKNYFVVNGLLPRDRLDRVLGIPIMLRPGESRFVAHRGDPLMAITIIADEKVVVTPKEEVPAKLLARTLSVTRASKLCPYKYTKNLFKRFF